jgi:biotin synthase
MVCPPILCRQSSKLAVNRKLLNALMVNRESAIANRQLLIAGDMLTTAGISIEQDMKMLDELGYKVALWNR